MMQTFRRIRAKAARSKIRVPRVWFWHLGLKPQFQALEERLPEIHEHRGVPPILPSGGRLIKTHEKYRREYGKAVFLVRDPRDVFLSAYAGAVEFGITSFVSEGDFDSFLLAFLQGRALQMGSWQEHTRSWFESPLASNGNLMIVRYEDLRQNSEQIVRQMLQFLGVTPDVRVIRKAIENNCLQRMRAKEDSARRAGEHSGLLFHRNSTSEDGRFVRKGAIGGWRNKLTDAQVKIIRQYAGDTLVAVGYEQGIIEEAVC